MCGLLESIRQTNQQSLAPSSTSEGQSEGSTLEKPSDLLGSTCTRYSLPREVVVGLMSGMILQLDRLKVVRTKSKWHRDLRIASSCPAFGVWRRVYEGVYAMLGHACIDDLFRLEHFRLSFPVLGSVHSTSLLCVLQPTRGFQLAFIKAISRLILPFHAFVSGWNLLWTLPGELENASQVFHWWTSNGLCQTSAPPAT